MGVVFAVAVTALVAASTVGAAPRVRTLATSPGRIVAFGQDGRFLAWASTSKTGATDVRAGGGRVVYRVGRVIWAIEETGRRTPVAVAATTPIGLSVNGRRLTWAENPGGHGRIRALTLP